MIKSYILKSVNPGDCQFYTERLSEYVGKEVLVIKLDEQDETALIALSTGTWWVPQDWLAEALPEVKVSNPLDYQVGGSHYSERGIQPIEYIQANDLNFCEGSIVKYITRWKDKGGIRDLQKIQHYAEFLIAKARLEGMEG